MMGKHDKPGVDIRRLRYFLAVCDHGGFSRAAVAIGVAQPALTRQVQLLEQELGVELVTRNGRSALPTGAGQSLMVEARQHLTELDHLVERIRRDFGQTPRRVVLGICPTITAMFLDHIREGLHQADSGLELSVVEAYSGDLRNLMASGGLDLAISYGSADDGRHRALDLLTERLVHVTPGPQADSGAESGAEPGPVSLEGVLREPLILPSASHQLRRIIETAAKVRGLTVTPALELDSLGAVKAMLDQPGRRLSTILPYHSVREDALRGRFQLRHIKAPDMVRTIALLQPGDTGRAVPAGLRDQIIARAVEIRTTMEAVA